MTLDPKIKFTVRDYMATPEDKRYELIEGDLLVTPSPTVNHQRIVLRLARWLSDFVEREELGVVIIAPMNVILSDYDVLQPDILFVSNERAHIVTDRVHGAPDLAVEVLSPGTEERDRVLKGTLYARHGVREYWLVDPAAQRIEVLSLIEARFIAAGTYGGGDTLSSSCLEGLAFPAGQLFAPAGP